MTHTPNGFDPRWVKAINTVLNDRETVRFRITDITDALWDTYIGPMIDAIEDKETDCPRTHD